MTAKFSTLPRPVVGLSGFLVGLLTAWSGLPHAAFAAAERIASDPWALASLAASAAAITAGLTAAGSSEERKSAPEIRDRGASFDVHLRDVFQTKIDAGSKEGRAIIKRRLLEDAESAKMTWELADAIVVALRAFAFTGSGKPLELVGTAVGSDAWTDDRRLAEIEARIRSEHPYADAPVSRAANPRVVVMKAHEEAVNRTGKPVPTHSFRWLKRYDRPMWYGFLNAGRRHLETFHPEGLSLLVELRAEGRPERREKAKSIEADRIVEDIVEEARRQGLALDVEADKKSIMYDPMLDA